MIALNEDGTRAVRVSIVKTDRLRAILKTLEKAKEVIDEIPPTVKDYIEIDNEWIESLGADLAELRSMIEGI